MENYSLAVLAGDGIGPEVTAEARKVATRAAELFGFSLDWKEFPFGAEYYLTHGVALPKSAFDDLRAHDALLFGAIGDPRVKPGPLEQEILLALRFEFDQYVNLRPAAAYPGVPLPVALPQGKTLDAVVVRENTEDLYMNIGGGGTGSYSAPLSAVRRLYTLSGAARIDMPDHIDSAFSLGFMTKPGIERITRYAFALAKQRGEKTVHVVSKANAVPGLYGMWDETTAALAKREFPEIAYASVNVDAACYLLARDPCAFRVLLCPNLFGDIVSDLLSGLSGGLGLAAAGNLGDHLSMFEPVHGSAPTITGSGKANPLAAVLSAAMLLDHLGEAAAAAAVRTAVRAYLGSGSRLPIELGGTAKTAEVGDLVCRVVAAEG